MKASGLAGLIWAVAAAGCGYTMGEPTLPGASSVAVPMARNETLRRGNEFGVGGHELDLTQQIRDMVISRTGYRLVPESDADIVAQVEILGYDTPFLVSDPADRPLVSNVSIEIRLTIRRRDGTQVFAGTKREVGYLVPSRDEDEGVARAEAFERLARWVVTRLEGGW